MADDVNFCQFAITLYAQHKQQLLHWQNTQGVHINDLLLLTYAHWQDVAIHLGHWQRINRHRYRQILSRWRALRLALPKEATLRPLALSGELAMEMLDLTLLGDCLVVDSGFSNQAIHGLSQDWRLTTNEILVFIESL